MGRKHRIRVTPEELEAYEKSLLKPKGREVPLAMTKESMQWLNPLKEPKKIRAPSSERRRQRKERPMTPRTAARRSRLVANRSPGREPGPRGYLCEVPSSAKGKRIVAQRRADARRDLPSFDNSRRQAARTFSASSAGRQPRSGSADRSRAPLWAPRERPSSAAPTMQSVVSQPSALWDRAMLAPAPSTCSLRPQRSLINEADREARLALRASAEATARQTLLATMASDPRPFTAPAARRSSPRRSPRASPRSSSVADSPDRSVIQVEDMSVQTALGALGHHGEHGALMLEIIRAEGVADLALGAMADSDAVAEELDPEIAAANAEKMQTFCQVALEGATWHTPITVGYQQEWRHLKTTFVEDSNSCMVLDIMSAQTGGKDLADGAQHHCCVAIKVSDLPMVPSERWYPLSRFNGECAAVATAGNAPEFTARVLLRTQFVPRAADAEAEHPDMHQQLSSHHKALSGLSESCAGQLSVTVVAGRALGGASVPVDSFAVVEYNGKTTTPTDAVFGAAQPEWNTTAGPFSVSPPDTPEDHGPPLVIRVHKWRAIHEPTACAAAYELLGAAAIDVRHAIHKWAHTTAAEKRAEIVVEAWVPLHSWAESNDDFSSQSAQSLTSCGDVLVRLAFDPSAFVRVERPLPYHTQLQVTLCQCHRLTGDLNSSVMIELSLHRSEHLAARSPPYGSAIETWQSKTVHEMFSPTFFETFSFSLHGSSCCLRLDVYEISGLQPAVMDSPKRARSKTMMPVKKLEENGSEMAKSADSTGSAAPVVKKTKVKKTLLCSSVVPFMRLIGTPAAHWYNLLPQLEINHSVHSKNVDNLLDMRFKGRKADEVDLPHGAIQFTAQMVTGNEGTAAVANTIVENHVHTRVVTKRHHARVTIKNVTVTGLPRVQATGRTGTGINKKIEPSPMVRFAFGEHSRQTSVHKSTFDAAFRDVIHLPFSWLDDGDGDLEPEELQAEMRLHGGLTCKVYHRATPNATVRDQLIGSVTLSLVELISSTGHSGGHSVSPGPRTYTIFNTTGHSVRQLKATGTVTIEATVEFEGQDELAAGETWEDPEDDAPGARGDHHLTQPNTQLHYMLKTAASLKALPVVDLDPELREPPAAAPLDLKRDADGEAFAAAAGEGEPTVTSLQLTVHNMRNIPESVARPVCRVYISSPPAVIDSPHGSTRSVIVSPTALSSSAEENAFVLAPDGVGQLAVEKSVSFNLPQLFAPPLIAEEPEEEEDEFGFGEAVPPVAEALPETRILHVEIFENVAASDEDEVVLGALLGGVSLPVARAGEWRGAGQQWHSLATVTGGDVSFADENGTDPETPGLELSLATCTALRKLAPHVICASSQPEETTATESEEGDESSMVIDDSEYHGARTNVRIFYDTTQLESLDDPHEIEAVLLEAKEIWSRHHHYDYDVEDLMPIMLEVFNKFKREDLPAEWEAKALQNIEHWALHVYRGGTLTVWTFKNFCAFWRQVIDDTVKYALWLGESFRDFYCRASAAQRFEELDEDNSGTLEDAERDNLISWILSFVYGANPSPSVERQMQAEANHFRHRLDDDGDSTITFDELHQYIFAHIKWMEMLRQRQEVALEAAKDRAVAVLQSAARGWLQRRALKNLLLESIPAACKEAMLYVHKIPLADAQIFKLRSYGLKHWGAVRSIAVRTKPDGDVMSNGDKVAADFPRSWAIVWMESKEKAAAAIAGQEEAVANNLQHFSGAGAAAGKEQFSIMKTDWNRIHSKKAITVLSEIWRSVPMAVVSSIPESFAEEGKLRDLFTQFGPVDAVGVAVDKDKSWALVTFRHETSILKATSQPVEVGAEAQLLHVEKAQFSQVTDLNKRTMEEQRGWDPMAEGATGGPGGLAGAMASAKGNAPKEIRETPEEVAARLHFSFQTNPANIERIVDRRTDVSKAAVKKGGRLTGGKVEYKVVWQGRFVSASWVSRDMMVKFATTRGMVLEHEDNLAEAEATALEAATAEGADRKRGR